jgi:site-specific recombinase XerD
MRQLISAFLLDRQAEGCTANTLAWHESSLTLFRQWVEQEGHPTDPTAWTPTLLRAFIVDLQSRTSKRGKPLSGASINSYVGSLLAFVRWLHQEDFIEDDLASRVKKPKKPQVQKHPYSDDELIRLLDAAKQTAHGLRDYAMLCILLDCGLRASELTNLTLDAVIPAQHLLYVRYGKGQKDRVVPFSPDTARALNRYLLRARHGDSPFVFLSDRGSCLTPNSLRQLIGRIAKSANVEGANVHRFRRSFAVSFLRNGGDSLILQRLLGHTSLTMVNVYVTLATDDLEKSHQAASPMRHLRKR